MACAEVENRLPLPHLVEALEAPSNLADDERRLCLLAHKHKVIAPHLGHILRKVLLFKVALQEGAGPVRVRRVDELRLVAEHYWRAPRAEKVLSPPKLLVEAAVSRRHFVDPLDKDEPAGTLAEHVVAEAFCRLVPVGRLAHTPRGLMRLIEEVDANNVPLVAKPFGQFTPQRHRGLFRVGVIVPETVPRAIFGTQLMCREQHEDVLLCGCLGKLLEHVVVVGAQQLRILERVKL